MRFVGPSHQPRVFGKLWLSVFFFEGDTYKATLCLVVLRLVPFVGILLCLELGLSITTYGLSFLYTHTHAYTHTHLYIYI